jgi:hypothetical protein
MSMRHWLVAVGLALAVTFVTTVAVRAADLRYHYAPVDAAGNTQLTPVVQPGAAGSPGERIRLLGLRQQPATTQPRPTHLVTFRHSYTHRNITVPLTLQPGTARMSFRRDSVLYNYGSESVEVEFLKDGSVDVVYSSGFLRRI